MTIDSGESLRDLRRDLACSRRDRSFFSAVCITFTAGDAGCWSSPTAPTGSCDTTMQEQQAAQLCLKTVAHWPYVSGGLFFFFSEGFIGGRVNF